MRESESNAGNFTFCVKCDGIVKNFRVEKVCHTHPAPRAHVIAGERDVLHPAGQRVPVDVHVRAELR